MVHIQKMAGSNNEKGNKLIVHFASYVVCTTNSFQWCCQGVTWHNIIMNLQKHMLSNNFYISIFVTKVKNEFNDVTKIVAQTILKQNVTSLPLLVQF